MTSERTIGVGIVLLMAIGAATGLVLGILHAPTAVGAAVTGIVLGTAIARGAVSRKFKGTKQS